jgi:hypothetical protein
MQARGLFQIPLAAWSTRLCLAEGRPVCRQRVEWQDAFIAAQQHCWPVAVLCEVLEGGRSGLDDDQKRQRPPALSPAEMAMMERLKTISAKTGPRDGSRRMAK